MSGSSCPEGTLALMVGPRDTGKDTLLSLAKNTLANDELPLLLGGVVVQFNISSIWDSKNCRASSKLPGR